MTQMRIKHMVIFCLENDKDSQKTKNFLEDGKRILTNIPGVERFEVFEQISLKNDYDYGFSMEFADSDAYQAYNLHPDHIRFVNERWLKEVTKFLEIDYKFY